MDHYAYWFYLSNEKEYFVYDCKYHISLRFRNPTELEEWANDNNVVLDNEIIH